MRVCLVSGQATNLEKMAKLIEGMKRLNAKIELKFRTIPELQSEIASAGISFLAGEDVVLLTDNAFGPVKVSDERIQMLRSFQDMLSAKRFRRKVYLITKDGDLVNKMKDPDKMDENFLYRDLKIIMYEKKLSRLLVQDTLLGEYDGEGVSHDDFGVESGKSSDDVIEETLTRLGGGKGAEMKANEDFYATNRQHISAFTKDEYADSPQNLAKRKKEKREQGRAEREKNKRTRDREAQVSKNLPTDKEGFVSPKHIQVSDQQISAYKTTMMSQKGVLAVTGNTGSGVSGVVANIAETYNQIDSTVAVLDLDIYKRYQTVYFSEYEDISTVKKGKELGLMPLVENYKSLENFGVNVKDKIDVYSISRYTDVRGDFEYELLSKLETILHEMKTKYDIVVLDIPISYLNHIDLGVVREIDATMFVTENQTIKIEDLLLLTLRTAYAVNTDAIHELMDSSFVAYNKYVDGRRGFDESEKCDGIFLEGILDGLARPFSKIRYIEHIPFDSRWENQIIKNQRWVERELENEQTFIGLLGKINYNLK